MALVGGILGPGGCSPGFDPGKAAPTGREDLPETEQYRPSEAVPTDGGIDAAVPIPSLPDAQSGPMPAIRGAVAWPEADALFRRDPLWLGGDGGSSVFLGGERILWLFDDSFIAKSNERKRSDAVMIRNALAIQTGRDPSTASVEFFWNTQNGRAKSFFSESGESWYWPSSGIVLGGKLFVFLMKECKPSQGGGNFSACGYEIVSIDNFSSQPRNWHIDYLHPPSNPFHVVAGSASLLEQGGFLCTFGSLEPSRHDIFLVRWSKAALLRGDASRPEWWCGTAASPGCDGRAGWVEQAELKTAPRPVMTKAQTEFTVTIEPSSGAYLEIQTTGYPAGPLAARWAAQITGPWSSSMPFFSPPEAMPSMRIYQGKAHPELLGADLIVTYETRPLDYKEQLRDMATYFPRFVKLTLR